MGRHTGPVEKLSRREGVELFLKAERALNGKSALERRGDHPPGQHGRNRRRKASIYSTQILRFPERADINAPVDEQLVVELYSRR